MLMTRSEEGAWSLRLREANAGLASEAPGRLLKAHRN
jgi:hypothetical protein